MTVLRFDCAEVESNEDVGGNDAYGCGMIFRIGERTAKRSTVCGLVCVMLQAPGGVQGAEQESGVVGKEVSLVTGQAVGELAVAGRLAVDLHAEFMASRSFDGENVLNWFNCGYSGGSGGQSGVGGTFGDFGMQVPA